MLRNIKLLQSISFVLLISISLLITGCARQDRKILNNFNNRSFDYEQTQKDVSVGVKFLTDKEFDTIFRSPSIFKRFYLSKKYGAIQLTIDNKTSNNYWLEKNSFNFKSFSTKETEKILKSGYLLSATTYIPSYLLLSILGAVVITLFAGHVFLFFTGYSGGAGAAPLVYTLFWGTLFVELVLLPFLFYRKVHKENKKIRKKIFEQVFDLENKTYVPQEGVTQKIIFTTKQDMKTNPFFNMTLFDSLGMNLDFMIPVKQNNQ